MPFLKPAIASAAVLAFLASFENYNTTVFTIISESTITTFLAAKVRHGINPSISALAMGIVILTLFGAALHEVLKRREIKAENLALRVAKGEAIGVKKAKPFIADPAVIIILLIFTAGLGTAYFAGTVGVNECKADYLAEKKRRTAEKIKQMQEKTEKKEMFLTAPGTGNDETEEAGAESEDKATREGTENFNSIFSTDNLKDQVGDGDSEEKSERKGTENFNNLFAPENLEDQVNSEK